MHNINTNIIIINSVDRITHVLTNNISKMRLATWPFCARSHIMPLKLLSLHLHFGGILTCHW